jgi:hypothetical protein
MAVDSSYMTACDDDTIIIATADCPNKLYHMQYISRFPTCSTSLGNAGSTATLIRGCER